MVAKNPQHFPAGHNVRPLIRDLSGSVGLSPNFWGWIQSDDSKTPLGCIEIGRRIAKQQEKYITVDSRVRTKRANGVHWRLWQEALKDGVTCTTELDERVL